MVSRGHPCNPHNFLLSHHNSKDFVSFQGGHVYPYLGWAVLWTLYHLAWIIVEIYWAVTDNENDALFFIYLTNLGYVILVSYTWLDLVAVIYFIVQTRNQGEIDGMPVLFQVNWVLYNIAMPVAILIVIIYWALLASSLGPGSINKHIINGIIALLNVCFIAKPSRILHFYQPMIFGVAYAVFTVIYYAAGGGNVYSVLDWSKVGSTLALVLPLVLVAIPVIHLAVCGIYRARFAIWCKCIRKGDVGPGCGARMDSEPSLDTASSRNSNQISTIVNETNETKRNGAV